jgi:asparagine synthase (glutamine-hydrolysing)
MLGTYELPGLDVAARLEKIAHRGPDGSGIARCGAATHGHVRLALLDLSDASAQPFKRGEGLLSFVGEIWNYRALRDELSLLGETFTTTGDTEVLAAALSRWGLEALPWLEGMYTFAWSRGETHVLLRDRYGKVPLHVYRRGRGFAWSSEIKGLGADFPSMPLPPGTALDLTTGRLWQWYKLPTEANARDLVAEIELGVRERLYADAPVCCLISGGLDSSVILAAARQAKRDVVAYTAKLNDGTADLNAARRLCREWEVPLVEVAVAPASAARLTEAVRVIELSSKAQVEIAALCLPLAEAIAHDGFKACLSGEAADELFGGYGSMQIKGASADDKTWRAIRVAQLDKMARGNFIRCNKVFMAKGVECRLPFMRRQIVEDVICRSKQECPPGKAMLRQAASALVPDWVARRAKETFQGCSGMADAASYAVANPVRYYNAEFKRSFGASQTL